MPHGLKKIPGENPDFYLVCFHMGQFSCLWLSYVSRVSQACLCTVALGSRPGMSVHGSARSRPGMSAIMAELGVA